MLGHVATYHAEVQAFRPNYCVKEGGKLWPELD